MIKSKKQKKYVVIWEDGWGTSWKENLTKEKATEIMNKIKKEGFKAFIKEM